MTENGNYQQLTYKNYVCDKYVGNDKYFGKYSEIYNLRKRTKYYYDIPARPMIFTRMNQNIFNMYESAIRENVCIHS